ncbi:hypothetical protein GCM10009827_084750 [Dactylosporangium maewongense]|uniref:Ankyrin repeat domain-containing protein n=2 Tax=Dactylosporangium maewongense TaxID=634393 RepID=A0ABN2C4R0_9ACTN
MRQDLSVGEQAWDGTTKAGTNKADMARRQRLADCAKRYDWAGVFAVLAEEPGLVNSARPGGASWFAPLHQAAHGGAPVEVVERLVALGAWRGLRTAAGDRPADLARRANHAHLAAALEPPRRFDVPAGTLRRIQVFVHAVIRARLQHLVDQHALRLPELEVLLELAEPRMSFQVPGMHGRFELRLDPAGPDTRLIVDVFAERHEVTAREVRVRERPDPPLVAVPGEGAGFAELVTFAHTYNGYDLHGGSEGLAEVVAPARREWERTGGLPGDLDVLRACLFFQQRSHYWDGGSWDFGTDRFVVALLARIRELSGGTVPHRSMKDPG